MADKMYVKDFVEAFNEVGFDFNIWGWEGILNMISSHCRETCKFFENLHKQHPDQGYNMIAEAERQRANQIYEILERRGYFNDICG